MSNFLSERKQNNFLKHHKNPLASMQHAIERVFNNFYHSFDSPMSTHSERWEHSSICPSVDIVNEKEQFKVEAEMPGVALEDIKISIEEDGLNIFCEKTTSQKDEGKNYQRREIEYGSYQRTIPLPKFLDTSKAKATFKKGMLWIDIPKTALSAEEGRKLLKVEQVE